ncbi:MAG: NINE protein [Candidatus Saccharibacteria bacterium]|nr:NINE protein [Candidatus Saccharibacteria bacterium]
MQNTKSATTAGLLGIFLGVVGAHNWYLGDKKKGAIHVSLFGAAILLIIVGNILVNTLFRGLSGALAFLGGGFMWPMILVYVGYALVAGSELWGFIEGVQILTGGDAGLAAKGYAVAAPQMGYNQGYGQPMQQQGWNQGYQQPMNNGYNQGYQQPMGQPMGSQGGYDPNMGQNGFQGPQNAPQGQMGPEMGQNNPMNGQGM